MEKTTFEWETINKALTRKGYSPKKISDILILLTREVERERLEKKYEETGK